MRLVRVLIGLALPWTLFIWCRRAFALTAIAPTAPAAAPASPPIAVALRFAALFRLGRVFLSCTLVGILGSELLCRVARFIKMLLFGRELPVMLLFLTAWLGMNFAAIAATSPPSSPPSPTAFAEWLGGDFCRRRFALAFLV